MKTLLLMICCLGLFLCCGGCLHAAAAFATPTQWEIKVPAEYNLSDSNKPQKLLVLVDQPAWLTSEANIRIYLTQAIETLIAEKADVKPEIFVPYKKLADMRANAADFASLTPAQIGKALNAQVVLYVVIDKFGLYEQGGAGYYKGVLDARSGLYDTTTGQMLWLSSGELKATSVGFEVQKGQEEAAKRLAQSTAKCVVRYFYDCPKPEFKVADEIKEEMKSW